MIRRASLLATIVLAAAPPTVRAFADDSIGGFSWDSTDRTEVVAGFARHYLPSEDYASHDGWTGDVDTCGAGTLSNAFLDDTMRRINWYRAQAGVPADVGRDAAMDAKCQAAALVMAWQGALSHNPAVSFPSNPCLSTAASQGAAASNLALGNYGPAAINDLMIDDGGNNTAVGHRRWTLYPPTMVMGTGAIPGSDTNFASHAQMVFGGPNAPTPPARPAPWPNEGFVPWTVVPNDGDTPARWSFTYPGAGFGAATVTVQKLGAGGGFLAVSKEAVAAGYGNNTMAWQVDGIADEKPDGDVTYRVTIDGVTGTSQSTYTYDVTLIDPYDLGREVLLDGPAKPPLAAPSLYALDGVEGADHHRVRVTRPLAESWTEGAEDAPSPRILDGTTGTYALRETAAHATGAKSFHLTATDFDHPVQSFSIDRILWPGTSATLHFKNLRRCATTVSRLEAQVSRNGHSWTTVWSRAGGVTLSCSSSNWDPSFQAVEVPIPAEFDGSTISVRFVFTIGAQAFIGTAANYGFYIDDVSVSDAIELGDADEETLPGEATQYEFLPADESERWLQAAAVFGDVTYAYGPPTVVEPGNLCGDANGDGKVSASDALSALRTAVGSGTCPVAICDVNGSGNVTATDALSVLKAAVGSPVSMNCP